MDQKEKDNALLMSNEFLDIINRGINAGDITRASIDAVFCTALMAIIRHDFCEHHRADGWNDMIFRLWECGAVGTHIIGAEDPGVVSVAACLDAMATTGIVLNALNNGDGMDAVITGFANIIATMRDTIPDFDVDAFLADTKTAVECLDEEEALQPEEPEQPAKPDTVH